MHTNRGWSAGAECYTETGGETRRDEAEGWMDGAVNTIGQSKRGGGDRSSRPAGTVGFAPLPPRWTSTGCSNRWCPKALAYRQDLRPHCPLGAHVFPEFAGAAAAFGSASRQYRELFALHIVLPWSFPGLANQGRSLLLLLSSSYRWRQGCRFRRHIDCVEPLQNLPNILERYPTLGIGDRQLLRHVET